MIRHAVCLWILGCLLLQAVVVHGRLRVFKEHERPPQAHRTARVVAGNNRSTMAQRAAECTAAIQTNSTVRNPPPMRISTPVLCDPEVRQRSGYVDLDQDQEKDKDNSKHVFFWHFGSRTRLAADFNATETKVPVVFWFSGGPGCSSQIANWQENGPCQYLPSVPYNQTMDDDKRKALPHGVERNPWAWNAVADLVFIDQPVGTGFSYGATPSSTEAAADTAWRAMQAVHAMLNADRASLGERPVDEVFLFGESYGGRYIPVFTEYTLHMNDIVNGSADLQNRGFAALPISGIGIGNGLFDYLIQSPTYKQMGCDSTYSPPLFEQWQCKRLDSVVNPECKRALEKCYGGSDPKNSVDSLRDSSNTTCLTLEPESWRTSSACAYADSYCNGALNWTTLANTYDVRSGARMPPDDYVRYLQSSEFMAAVGVNASAVLYTECSDAVFDRFSATSDEVSRSATAAMEYILNRKVPILLYTGDADFICNWYGTMLVARALKWHGAQAFDRAVAAEDASPAPWKWPTKSGKFVDAGEFWAAENLTFLRVYQAGHEVPYYQPQASLYMLAQFIWHRQLY
ncbi:hypothetical protein H4S06_000546 [Coemansia sp. BCRC 34490]|nr:hypothetical protein H4S06_000546 [Coemansia sp. BCRC 34490]